MDLRQYKNSRNMITQTQITQHPFKVTMKGSLEFGRSYDTMKGHFEKRLELYYKNDIVFKNDSYYQPEIGNIVIPRTEFPCSERTWKNTISMLRELRSFSVAGVIHFWVTDLSNNLIHEEAIEPTGDKAASVAFENGKKFLRRDNQEHKAIESLTKAIEKFERFAQAYERRGVAYCRLGQTEDALMDFSRSLTIEQNPHAYFGRAKTKQMMGDLNGAIEDLALAIKNAVPFQPIFWSSRRLKGEIHLTLGQAPEACFELKFVTKRAFKDSDPNFAYRRHAWEIYAQALRKDGKTKEAEEAIVKAKALAVGKPQISNGVDLNKKHLVLN
jgi:tetratricopeptide (TPR) repeat protein